MMDEETITGILGAKGSFAREVPGFAPREVQQTMARAVAQAIDRAGTLVAEAGTGTGKTFAYLVPALVSGKRVIVSTGTKTLQDQLFHRDLPRVRQVLGVPLKASLLKGRANYLCRYRYDQTLRDGQFMASVAGRAMPAVRAWAARTSSGDRMELAEVPENSPIWPRVTSTVENCLGSECPFFDDCYVFKARRAAQESDLVVVNHHLLLADMALKADGYGEILPGAHAFILDEAHQIPELAGQFFSQTASARQASELVRDALTECGELSGALDALRAPLEAIEPLLREARLALVDLPERGAFVLIERQPAARDAIEALAAGVATLEAALLGQAERSRGMAAVHARAQLLRSRLKRVLDAEGEPGDVRWYETSAHGFQLSVTPLDIATPLRRWREDSGAAWI
ncbi:MAG TPA: ATP-dependent DNA helicase, partial [Rhodanobacteraceae bacterium]|nr:ATP-dependent DNA helicase [Rhodanobacteraceae bacterium]